MSLLERLPYEWHIGWRYTRAGRAGRRNRFISFISGVSMLGIALGVAALIIVLSVMNGFQKELRERMLSVISHIEVFDSAGGAIDFQLLGQVVGHDTRAKTQLHNVDRMTCDVHQIFGFAYAQAFVHDHRDPRLTRLCGSVREIF